MNKNLLIVGAGQYGALAKEIAEAMNCFEKIDFLDDNSELAIGKISEMERFAGEYSFGIVAMGNHELRYRYTLKLEDNYFKIPILIHPKSFVGQYANIQKGCIIEPMATVQSGAILGVSVLVSAGCIVNHSVFIGDYCHLDVGSIVKSKSLMKAGTKLEAGEVFGRIDSLQENGNNIASYQKDEEWVKQFAKDFGTEPSFF